MNTELGAVLSEETAVRTNPGHSQGAAPPVFVIGVWRSGTTLLFALLNHHPDISLFYEGDLPLLWPMFRIPFLRKSWAEKWEYWNASLTRHGLDLARLDAPVSTLAEAAELAGRQYSEVKGGKVWGCKSPSYCDRLESLAREFPRARFVVIWRDPEEICRSVNRAANVAPWFARSGSMHRAIMACEKLKAQCDKLLAEGHALHQIHYRDLVEDTRNTMKGICEFLDLPFAPECATLEGADRSAVFEGAHHSMAKGNRIVAQRNPKGELPSDIAGKIQRYKALWKAKYGDHWLLCKYFDNVGSAKPGFWERTFDRLRFRILRFVDALAPFIYSILPRAVWQSYRTVKYRDAQYVHRQLTKKHTTVGSHASR